MKLKFALVLVPVLTLSLLIGISSREVAAREQASAPHLATAAGVVPAVQLAAGAMHTCALTSGGGVKCWGSNSQGQLGDGTTMDRIIPVDVELGGEATAIATGNHHTCALTSGGGVKCWGEYFSTWLGNSPFASTPVDVDQLGSGVTAIAAGYDHACALTSGGGVKCWGWNWAGQLGDGTTVKSITAVDVAGLGSGVIAIAAGGSHTCALTSGGGLKCWGRNIFGQLGDGTTSSSNTPVDVAGLGSGVAAVAAGSDHTCAVTSGGGVKCWGWNWTGQLGDDSTSSSNTPVDVVGLSTGVTAISANWADTCALISGGRIKCWGLNGYGQLGDETTTSSSTPVDAKLDDEASAVSAGRFHTSAVISAGFVKCWGWNSSGQLGDGTTTDSSQPLHAVGFGTLPATPTVSSIANPELDGVYPLSWTAVAHAVSYEVQEQLNGGSWNTSYSGANTSLDLTGKTDGVWCYQARASNVAGDSNWSEIECTSVDMTAPPVPAGILTCAYDHTSDGSHYYKMTYGWDVVSDSGPVGMHQSPYWAQLSTQSDFATVVEDPNWPNGWDNINERTGSIPFIDNTTLYAHVRSRDANDNQSAWSASNSLILNASNCPGTPLPPTPKFTADRTSGIETVIVTFADQSTGDITSWSWDFGDGDTSTQQHPTHEYGAAGDYTVSLIVTGPGGSNTETKSNYITVVEPSMVISAEIAGHFPDGAHKCDVRRVSPLLLECSASASTPLTVTVREQGTAIPLPQAQITLLPDGTLLGKTDPSGILNSRIPIAQPPRTEERIVSLQADVDGNSRTSDPVVLFSSTRVGSFSSPPITQDEIDAYDPLLVERVARRAGDQSCRSGVSPAADGICLGVDLLGLLTRYYEDHQSTIVVGDIIQNEVFQHEASGVVTAFSFSQEIERNESMVYAETAWSEESDDFLDLAGKAVREGMVVIANSPVALFLRDPSGRGAGYNPVTRQLEFEFPIAISEIGDEPYKLIVPAPIPGKYSLQVIGLESGSYTLTLYGLDQNGQATPSQSLTKEIAVDVVTEYELTYSEGVVDLPDRAGHDVPLRPDLVVRKIVALQNNVQVTIENQGTASVAKDNGFWVDVYINPDLAPTEPNDIWNPFSAEGLVWGVDGPVLPMEPGEVITLSIGDSLYWPEHSTFSGSLSPGTIIYAQVDSANTNSAYGGILETHEAEGGEYNNILGPVAVTATALEQELYLPFITTDASLFASDTAINAQYVKESTLPPR